MELWGGLECTLNRVGNRRCDQLALCRHYERGEDLERIAALGIRTLRYPLLWERAATGTPGDFDWRFADDRLTLLRELGLRPIAGLLHHGSGPDGVDMMTDSFAQGLALYAGRVARRFPWLEFYTPVNEPNTTARFCGLYGHWYPHGQSDHAFARILVNQSRATVMAMRAIRIVNPRAQLVQTDDLGTIYSTGRLAHQAEFENHRRWLGWDLLCGMVDGAHPLYDWLRSAGIGAHELAWFQDHPCPPQIVGIDHYVTSDRFLDEKLQRYPTATWGGNGRETYADVEAVRVLDRPGTSLRHVVQDAANRYRTPVALTEVHIGCTEDEQIRWLHEAWCICHELEATGLDIRAVTAWSLMGAYDWDSLLTLQRGHYEPGAFTLESGAPRPTGLAGYIVGLTSGDAPDLGSLLSRPGWWRQDGRLLYGAKCPIASLVA
jgi:dTDP-4-dehydrorhamnose reductase